MSTCDVSVIVRTCNRPGLLQRALRSIGDQTVCPREIIVINEGGAPSLTEEAVAAVWLSAPVRCIHHTKPLGRGAALNAGLNGSAGRWIAILDDDDTWMPTFLERTSAAMAAGAVAGVVARTWSVLEKDDHVFTEISRAPFLANGEAINLQALARRSVFTINAFLYRKDLALELGGYRTDLEVQEDWEFNLRYWARHPVAQLPELLACYHMRPSPGRADHANTGRRKQEEVRQMLIEEWLRADLHAGRFGLGALVLISDTHETVERLGFLLLWRARLVHLLRRLGLRRTRIHDHGRRRA